MAKPFMCGDEFPVYIPEGGCDCNYSLISVTDDRYAAAYVLTLNGERVGEQISIPKDMVVESGVVNTVIEDGIPYAGAIAGDKYLMLTIANSSTPIYVSLKELQTGGYLVVDELPAEGDGSHIYLVPNQSDGYDRYVWVDDEWINLGDTEIDLSNYYTKAEVNSGFYTKQEVDALIPTIPDAHPVGSVVVTDTNTNPSSTFGGSWTLIDKEFKSKSLTSGAAWQTGSGQSYRIQIKGEEIWFHASFTSTIQFADTDIPLVHIPLATIGLTDMNSSEALGYSDTGGGILMLQVQKLNSTTIRISSLDVVSHNSNPGIMPSNMTIRIDCPIRFEPGFMLDSFCDRFFWKRTA